MAGSELDQVDQGRTALLDQAASGAAEVDEHPVEVPFPADRDSSDDPWEDHGTSFQAGSGPADLVDLEALEDPVVGTAPQEEGRRDRWV